MEKKFNITGMGCSACSARIEKGVSAMEGVTKCEVNLLTNSMVVEFDGITAQDICAKVDDLGYGATEEEEETHPTEAVQISEEVILRKRFFTSLCFALPLFVISMFPLIENMMIGSGLIENMSSGSTMIGSMLSGTAMAENALFKILYVGNPDYQTMLLVKYAIELALVIPIIVINFKFYKVGIPALLRGGPNMDSLVAVGTIASVAIMSFDSAGMILTLVTLGKWLEARAKDKTTDALKGLMRLTPETATVIRDGNELIVQTSAIRKGERVLCHPGEAIAVDGLVIKGASHVNQSAITGESHPVEIGEGVEVIGGTINIDGYFEYEARSIGKDTVIAKIIKLVEEASSSKAPISRIADKVAGIFVPVVMGIALITFAIWMICGYGAAQALNFAISVLVISCPCAMGLATPVAIMVGTGKCAAEGIIVKSASSLENLGKADTVVFDKTGTITEGLVLDDVSFEERLAGDKSMVDTSTDRIRPEAAEVISKLKSKGIMPVLLSGDKREHAERVANEVGIERFYSDVFPQDKERIVHALQDEHIEIDGKQKNRTVVMIGDGINDAPAITRADVGIAIGSGTDIAIDAADMVLMGDGIGKMERAISLSKSVVKNIKLSLFWAFFYNALCIPLAAGVLFIPFGIQLSPMIAALCMSLSSVTVVTNALRLKNA